MASFTRKQKLAKQNVMSESCASAAESRAASPQAVDDSALSEQTTGETVAIDGQPSSSYVGVGMKCATAAEQRASRSAQRDESTSSDDEDTFFDVIDEPTKLAQQAKGNRASASVSETREQLYRAAWLRRDNAQELGDEAAAGVTQSLGNR